MLLLVYVLFSLGMVTLTWRNWWLDARLAAPAHLADMAVFTGIVFSANGYTSPFFLFFTLPLLSAAIRWGWRETAGTAAALIILYLAAGLLVTGTRVFELQRFMVRSGHLLIMSALLIWFGMHQQATRLFFGIDDLDRSMEPGDDPFVQALRLAMSASRASDGALLLQQREGSGLAGIAMRDGAAAAIRASGRLIEDAATSVLLFDLGHNRTVSRRPDGWLRFRPASRVLDVDALSEIGAASGLACEVRTGTHSGWLLLWNIADLSVDFVELGPELGRAAGAVLDRDALLSAIEEGAAARTRLSLARDVHDGVVQFLAGTAFRVEAMMRSARGGHQVDAELNELKRLLIDEQGEIRTFVTALRRDRELELEEVVDELTSLARRLAHQWAVECKVTATRGQASVPVRVQFDLQQLLREAIANAVRHGGASRIDVTVEAQAQQLRLQVRDNGTGFGPPSGGSIAEPWSLKERIERAKGTLSLMSEPGCTNVLITLPLEGAAA